MRWDRGTGTLSQWDDVPVADEKDISPILIEKLYLKWRVANDFLFNKMTMTVE